MDDPYTIISSFKDANATRVEKPWGMEYMMRVGGVIFKVIKIDGEEFTSLQMHNIKHEVIHIIDGSGSVDVYNEDHECIASYGMGESVYITPKTIHRSWGPLTLLEVTTDHNNDIVRLADDYGRTNKS